MSETTWKRAKKPGFAGELTRDQLLRLSAIVGLYKALELYFDPPLSRQWVKLPNRGPEFDGARPLDVMIRGGLPRRSEEHTSELQSLMRISYAVFCLKKKQKNKIILYDPTITQQNKSSQQ